MSKFRAQPHVVFMGMRGQFSLIPLAHLLAAGIVVQAVVVPAASSEKAGARPVQGLTPEPGRSDLPLLTRFSERNAVHLAWERQVPVMETSRLDHPETLSTLSSYQPDVICVACFNQRFSPDLLALPRHGCLNLHPSLLPAYRGPAPLFWAMRNGEQETGVTVHFMDEGIDTGDILLQERIAIPEGISGQALEKRCATTGAELMVKAVRSLWAGAASPREQPGKEASYDPWPSPADFRVSPERPARWAFNFIRGVDHWDRSVEIHVAGERFLVQEALSFSAEETMDAPFLRVGDDLWVQFSPGVLHVALQ